MTTGERKHPFKRTLKYDSKWLDSKQLTHHLFSCRLTFFYPFAADNAAISFVVKWKIVKFDSLDKLILYRNFVGIFACSLAKPSSSSMHAHYYQIQQGKIILRCMITCNISFHVYVNRLTGGSDERKYSFSFCTYV